MHLKLVGRLSRCLILFAALLLADPRNSSTAAGIEPKRPLPSKNVQSPEVRIVRQPISQGAFAGSDVELSVLAEGPAPLSYQWFAGTNALPLSATIPAPNSNLSTLSFETISVTNAGNYSVVVSSGTNSIKSDVATLHVQVGQASVLRIANGTRTNATQTQVVIAGDISATNTFPVTQHRFPVALTVQGDDRAVAFQIGYNSTVVAAASFEFKNDLHSNAVFFSSQSPGILSAVYSLPTNAAFTTLTQILGTLVLNTSTNLSPLEALIGFRLYPASELPSTNQIALWMNLPIATTRVYGTNTGLFPLSIVFQPQVVEEGPLVLNRQTGYYVQAANLINISPDLLNDTRLVVVGLTNDTRGVPVSLVTSIGPVGTPPNPSIFLGPIAAYGGPQRFLLEYYISDGLTNSLGRLGYVAEGASVYWAQTSEGRRSITPTFQSRTDGMLLEFQTLTNFSYYVRYSESLTDFSAQTVTNSQIHTALPAFKGNGRLVQWLDNGPPRTYSAPTNRFYRILEFR